VSGKGVSAVPIRPYEESDRIQIESFTCVHPWHRWRIVAQQIIRESPDECEKGGAEISVAYEGPEIVGVAVYREEPSDASKWEICSIGVLIPRQNQGIGTRLKQAVLAEVVARKGTWDVISTVNKRNGPMLAINRKLEAQMRDDPDDSKHILTLIRAEPHDPLI
jgi:RimJ/RimL family protein N-acetyltransferase